MKISKTTQREYRMRGIKGQEWNSDKCQSLTDDRGNGAKVQLEK